MTTTSPVTPTREPAGPVAGRHAGFASLLQAEWTKIRSVRSTVWTLVIFVVVCVGLTALIAWLTESHWNGPQAAPRDARVISDPRPRQRSRKIGLAWRIWYPPGARNFRIGRIFRVNRGGHRLHPPTRRMPSFRHVSYRPSALGPAGALVTFCTPTKSSSRASVLAAAGVRLGLPGLRRPAGRLNLPARLRSS
jgi:hypothetical protein